MNIPHMGYIFLSKKCFFLQKTFDKLLKIYHNVFNGYSFPKNEVYLLSNKEKIW